MVLLLTDLTLCIFCFNFLDFLVKLDPLFELLSTDFFWLEVMLLETDELIPPIGV